jgi:hypothetical protein
MPHLQRRHLPRFPAQRPARARQNVATGVGRGRLRRRTTSRRVDRYDRAGNGSPAPTTPIAPATGQLLGNGATNLHDLAILDNGLR